MDQQRSEGIDFFPTVCHGKQKTNMWFDFFASKYLLMDEVTQDANSILTDEKNDKSLHF